MYNKSMEYVEYIKTDDGSIGLFDKKIGDIYHSKSGALKEAFDKYINPSFLKEKSSKSKEINILDICSGAGYNLKSAILTADCNCKVNIDCLEINSDVINLSPFIADLINDVDIKILLLSEVIKLNNYDYSFFNEVLKVDTSFLCPDMRRFIEFLFTEGYLSNGSTLNRSFLHNIYYNYVSNNTNYTPNCSKYNNINVRYFIGDARYSLKSIDNTYDIVFLDAFSPQKDPTLWTIDFLSLIKSKLNKNSVLVTYSKSTPFRSALLELGFCVGKTFIDKLDMGTVASFDSSLIINHLNNYDLKLISTRSGIPFRDYDLSLSYNQIIKNRDIEMSCSDRVSMTQFLKNYY